MKTILFFVAVTSMKVADFGQQNVADLLDHYLKLTNALFHNDSRGVLIHSGNLLQSLNNYEAFGRKSEMIKLSQNINGTIDMDKQRAALADLSVIMWQAIKNGGVTPQIVYYYYCPMKKAYWLSNQAEIKNPYYGIVMPSCGTLTDQKNPRT